MPTKVGTHQGDVPDDRHGHVGGRRSNGHDQEVDLHAPASVLSRAIARAVWHATPAPGDVALARRDMGTSYHLAVVVDDAAQGITLVTRGTPAVIEQIKAQVGRIVPVHSVNDLTVEGPSVERELGLFKVRGTGDKRVEALRIADIYRAKVVDSTLESFVFEITGAPEKLDAFADMMRPLGLCDLARTGVAALVRGN